MHWAAMWAATEMYLQPDTACREVSCWPQAVPCSYQLAKPTPTVSLCHSAVFINCVSAGEGVVWSMPTIPSASREALLV